MTIMRKYEFGVSGWKGKTPLALKKIRDVVMLLCTLVIGLMDKFPRFFHDPESWRFGIAIVMGVTYVICSAFGMKLYPGGYESPKTDNSK